MIYEYSHCTTTQYMDNNIIIIEKKRAREYKELSFINEEITFGVFLSEDWEIIGINTHDDIDFYSPNKIKNQLSKKLDEESLGTREHDEEHLQWWNRMYNNEWNDNTKRRRYEETSLRQSELENYFHKVTEKRDDAQWTTYYINPPCGFNIKLGMEHSISFNDNHIKKIMVYEGEHEKYNQMIYCYDENEKWVEDVDIHTNLEPEEIFFVFDSDDLERSSTLFNSEQLSYIELYEKLNPYNDVEENREIINEWIRENKK